MKLTKILNEKQFQDLITATVSHDMKTPLNSIIASCEEIKPYTKHNKKAERLRKINLASGRLLLSLVNDLLDLFQIKNKKFTKRMKSVDVRKFLKSVTNLIKVQLVNRPIELIVNIASNIPPKSLVDSDRIAQVLINLFSNALKFTTKGYIKLSCSYSLEEQMLEFSVEDTGIGIKEEDVPLLFILFGKLRRN